METGGDPPVLDLGQPEDLAKFVLGREVDLEAEGWGLSQPLYDYLARYPLTQAHLDSVTTVGFDGGNLIYPYAWYHWDGESGEFDVKSLAGIELCTNLTAFVECTMVESCDLARLLPLKQLESIELFAECPHRNAEALLELPLLSSLKLRDTTLGKPGEAVLKALSTRGVEIKIYT